MAFSRDSPRLVTLGEDNTIQLWDTKGQSLNNNQFQELQDEVSSVAFSSDGQRLATGANDGTTRLWSIQGQELAKFHASKGYVSSLAFSRRLANSWLSVERIRLACIKLHKNGINF